MSSESDWTGVVCDLFHFTHLVYKGLDVSLRPIEAGHAILIRNCNEEARKIKLDWYNIPVRRKKKVYDLKPGQQKRFVVPTQRRVTILWKLD